MAYTRTTWVDQEDPAHDPDVDPAICAATLNNIEQGIADAHENMLTVSQLETTITDDDAKVPSSGAVVDYVAAHSPGDMLKSTYDSDGDGKVNAAVAADSVPWSGVSGKPATFPPGSHNHAASEITSGTLAANRLSSTPAVYTIDPLFPKNKGGHYGLGNATLGEMAINRMYVQNKLLLTTPYKIEYTTDGSTWVDYTLFALDSTNIRSVFADISGGDLYIRCPATGNWLGLRITLRTNTYYSLNYFYCYCSTHGHKMDVLLERSNLDSTSDFITVGQCKDVYVWPGHVMIGNDEIWLYPYTETPTGNRSRYARITFTPIWNDSYSSNHIHIYNISWFGEFPANTSNPLYSWDCYGNYSFKGAVTAEGGYYSSQATKATYETTFDTVDGKLVTIEDGLVVGTAASTALTTAIGSHGQVPTTDQKAALAGTSGTPSASNKYVTDTDPRLTNARDPKDHTHGNISNAGAIGTTANLPIITTTGGVLTTGTFGTSAGTFCQGNDPRLVGNAKQADRPFVFQTGHTAWATGLSNEEIGRIQLRTGETLYIKRVEIQIKGGGTSSSLSVNVYDSTNNTTIASQTAGGVNTTGGNSGAAALVLIRLTNSTGSTRSASVYISGWIRS